MDKDLKDYMLPHEYDRMMESHKWLKEIPFISFPTNWQVQVSPPFGGAVVRFRVKCNGAEISVYLDCYDRLGCYGAPYWEVWPYDGNVVRCDMNNTDELLSNIEYAIKNYGK